jgi:hypothetical protein
MHPPTCKPYLEMKQLCLLSSPPPAETFELLAIVAALECACWLPRKVEVLSGPLHTYCNFPRLPGIAAASRCGTCLCSLQYSNAPAGSERKAAALEEFSKRTTERAHVDKSVNEIGQMVRRMLLRNSSLARASCIEDS